MIRTSHPEKYYDYDGIKIRYIDIGEGEPILALHGLGGKIEDNENCFQYLAKRYRVIAMDCPGSGYSDKPDISYGMDYLVDFALDFASRLGLDRFYLLGGSQGGMHALLCCREAPERIIKAVVYSPSGVWSPLPLLSKVVKLLPPESVKTIMSVTSFLWNSPFYPDYWKSREESLEFIMSREFPGFGRHVLDCIASQFDRDYRKIYAEVKTPVRILWGQHDFGMPVAQGRRLSRILPDCELIEVPRAGHNVSLEMPEFFSEKVIEFFSG